MLDHIFLTVGDLDRAIGFCEAVLPILGINRGLDDDGDQGPAGHPTSRALAPMAACSSGCGPVRQHRAPCSELDA